MNINTFTETDILNTFITPAFVNKPSESIDCIDVTCNDLSQAA